MNANSPLVEADWLIENQSAPDLRIIDATWYPAWVAGEGAGRKAYESGHIPGAVFFDIDRIADTSSPLPHMMPDPVTFSSRVRKLGIGDGHRLVVYDSNDFFASARVWWMFRLMGHKDIAVLNGGRRAWLRAGGKTEDLPPVSVERHFTPRVQAHLVKDGDQVADAASSGSAAILDARPTGRFEGSAPEPREDLASGHMPNARNIPSSSLIESDGKLAPKAVLEEQLGAYRDGPVITSCGSGVSAAVIALALAELGNWDAAVYDGSWTDWASTPGRDIVTGPA